MTDVESIPPPMESPVAEPPVAAARPRPKLWKRRVLSEEELSDRRLKKWAELYETIVLALATLATAWAGYQAGQWNNLQTVLNNQATNLRIEASQLAADAQQSQLVDVALFTEWVNATALNRPQLAGYYRARFRDEFTPAFEAWLATGPETNPDAPASPFDMPEYGIAALEKADALIEQSGLRAQNGESAGSFGDQYTISVVILAGALLLGGIANRFEWAELRATVVAIALLILLFCVVTIVRLPLA